MKIAHIFSDEKFIDKHILKYKNCDFSNRYFYLKKSNNYHGDNLYQVEFIQPGTTSYIDLLERIRDFDIIILYYLTIDKINFVKDIWDSNVIIIWSFYGAELYALPNLKYKMLSEKTQIAMNIKWSIINIDRVKEYIRTILYFVSGRKTNFQLVKEVSQRINYFLWYNKFEYEYLNSFFNQNLPDFLPATLNNQMDNIIPRRDKIEGIIIGNSRDPFNNHIEAIEILEKVQYKGRVSIPFNYGTNLKYSEKIRTRACSSDLNINFLEEFVTYNEYIGFINLHKAAIFPSYRQIGLGNIFIAIRCGLKIYLSEKNPTYRWLLNLGMQIFSFDNELEYHLLNDEIILNSEQNKLNNDIYSAMVDESNNFKFFNDLRSL